VEEHSSARLERPHLPNGRPPSLTSRLLREGGKTSGESEGHNTTGHAPSAPRLKPVAKRGANVPPRKGTCKTWQMG